MGVPVTIEVAIALVALTLAVFALFACLGLFFQLRDLLDRSRLQTTEAGPDPTMIGKRSGAWDRTLATIAPLSVRPYGNHALAFVAVLDSTCTDCILLWDMLSKQSPSEGPCFGVVSGGDLSVFESSERSDSTLTSNPEVWTDLYDGFCPQLLLIDAQGIICGRWSIYDPDDVAPIIRSAVRQARRTSTDVEQVSW